MKQEFLVELISEVRANPRLRAYDYAMRLSDRGFPATENRVNRALTSPLCSTLIKNGMVATHDHSGLTQPAWFNGLSATAKKKVPRTAVVDHSEEMVPVAGLDSDETFLLKQIGSRGKSALGHYKRVVSARALAAKLSKASSR